MTQILVLQKMSWPGTTLDGDPGIVSGTLMVTATAGGELLLNLAVGPADGGPAESDYVEFPLSREHARALAAALVAHAD